MANLLLLKEREKECNALEKDLLLRLVHLPSTEPPSTALRELQHQFFSMSKVLALAIQNEENVQTAQTYRQEREKVSLTEQVNDLRECKHELETELTDLEQVTYALRADIDRRWRHEVQLESHAANLERERKETLADVLVLQEELDSVRKSNVQVTSALALAERRVADFQQELLNLAEAISAEKRHHHSVFAQTSEELKLLSKELQLSKAEQCRQEDIISQQYTEKDNLQTILDHLREQLEHQLDLLKKERWENNQKIDGLDREIASLKDTLREVEGEKEKITAQLEFSEERRDRQTKESEMEIKTATEKQERMAAALEKRERRIEEQDQLKLQLDADLQRAKKQLAHMEQTLEKRMEENDATIAECDKLRGELEQLSTQSTRQIEVKENAIRELKTDLEKAKTDLAQSEHSLVRRGDQMDELKAQMEELQNSLAVSHQTCVGETRKVEECQFTIVTLSADVEKLRNDLRHTKQLLQDHEKATDKLRETNSTRTIQLEDTVRLLQEQVSSMRDALSQQKSAQEDRIQTLAERNSEISQLKLDVAAAQIRFTETNSLLERKTEEAEMVNGRLRKSLAELENFEQASELRLQQTQAELSKRTSEARVLYEKVAEQEQVVAKLREEVQHTNLTTLPPSKTTPSQKTHSTQKSRGMQVIVPSSQTVTTRTTSEFAIPSEVTPSKRRKLLVASASSAASASKSGFDSASSSPNSRSREQSIARPSSVSRPDFSLANKALSTKPRKQKVVISFSGFKDTEPDFTMAHKNELSAIAIKLGAVVRETDQEFDQKITHVVTASTKKTLKVFAASVSSKFIMKPQWLLSSKEAGYFLPEESFGVRYTGSPFDGKMFYLSPSFVAENIGAKAIRSDNSRTLIESLGGGLIVKKMDTDVDYVLAGDRDTETYPNGEKLTWRTFLLKIPVPT